jgi:alkylation response protein AidB-like acyl-CoA dehydrogenase
MSRFLSPTDQEIQSLARKFAQTEVRPRRLEAYEKEGHENFYRGFNKRIGELGLIGTLIPEEFGGSGMGSTTACLVLEELGRESPGLAVSTLVSMTMLAQLLIPLAPEVRARFLPGVLSGDLMMAGAMSDPAGITNFAEQVDLAQMEEDEFVLNGTRLWVTNGNMHDVMWLMGLHKGAMHAFLVERGHPGVSVRPLHKMGFGAPWGIITMTDCRVSRSMTVDLSALVKDRELVDHTGKTTPPLVYISAIALGAADRVFEITRDYLMIRTNRGKPLAQMQALQHKLVRLKTQIEAGRSFLYDAARLRDDGRVDGVLDHMVKAWVPEMAADVIRECMMMHGGTGYAVETHIEGYLRDVLGASIGDCTADMHMSSVAALWGLPGAEPGAF